MCEPDLELSLPVAGSDPDAAVLRDAVRDAYRLLMLADPESVCAADADLWIERAEAVLAANITSGRFASACRYEEDHSVSLSRYAQQVLSGLMAEWERVEGLLAGDDPSWTAVLRHMERRAYFWLGPAGREEWARGEARDVASKTTADLWDWLQHNTFPFDVSFDRWAERSLRNRLHDSVRFRQRQARYVVDSLDRACFEEGHPDAVLLPTDDMRVWLELESNREVLRQAWPRLNHRQAHIIRRWYIEGWSADEIAAETRLAVNHIYVLKHRAIKKLREYCADA